MRQPLEATPRAAMTVKRKLEAMVFHATCYLCGERLGELKSVQFDHVLPLDLGGTDAPENIRPAHAECHRTKTRLDVKRISKARRLRKSEAAHNDAVLERQPGEKRKRKGSIPSRPFSPMKRGFR